MCPDETDAFPLTCLKAQGESEQSDMDVRLFIEAKLSDLLPFLYEYECQFVD